jgi:hypothetical protein
MEIYIGDKKGNYSSDNGNGYDEPQNTPLLHMDLAPAI